MLGVYLVDQAGAHTPLLIVQGRQLAQHAALGTSQAQLVRWLQCSKSYFGPAITLMKQGIEL